MVNISDNTMRISIKREVDESYNVVFGARLFPQIASDLKESPIGSRYAIITDSKVRGLYAESLEESLKNQGLKAGIFSFEAGENSKTIHTCINIIGQMSEKKYGRDSAILALGGGVVGDTAGFIAKIFNRGIPYVLRPTTFLAQADSSVGGKTAVDTEYGKNLVGAFNQPEKVYIDVSTLMTLSDREYRSGLAETIKHGIIADAQFFSYLQDNVESERSPETLLYLAQNNCRIKGNVVEIDPNEVGPRRILNYGHTAGHAIEKLSNYELSHGEAVSIGMMVAGRIANILGYFPQDHLETQEQVLKAYRLPTTIPDGITDQEIIDLTSTDKKAVDGKARYALPVAIGRMHEFGGSWATYVDSKVVEQALQMIR